MSKIFTGSIGRLLVVAGHSGSGKTTFLRDSQRYLNVTNYPPHLEDFHDLAVDHINIGGLKKYDETHFKNLCLHVDLSMPIRRSRPGPQNRAELEDLICPAMYKSWSILNQYLIQAEHIDIVTYFVRREVHFSRWIYNKSIRDTNGEGGVRNVLAAVGGDSTDNSGLHRKVYRAWIEYVEMLECRSMAVIDANKDEYRFMEISEFNREIKNQYKS